VAATHGQRVTLHKLLAHPHNANNKEVLSLEEILAEGASSQLTADCRGSRLQVSSELQILLIIDFIKKLGKSIWMNEL
jgi:hypothetical protein